MGKTCCFFGHSEIWEGREAVSLGLADAVERHITRCGVTEFLVGNYGVFDRMAADAVKGAKTRHPDIHLYLMLPYPPGDGRNLPDMKGFDGSVYPSEMDGVPKKLAISRLNRLMVRDADYAVAYVLHSWGGAAATMKYAGVQQRKGRLHIENLADAP